MSAPKFRGDDGSGRTPEQLGYRDPNHCQKCNRKRFYDYVMRRPDEMCQCEDTKRALEATSRMVS